ncbi:ABC transporter permease [Lacibacterium aquatile]|uniref:ABC transporter permease n=1 Tax=Lacibacterium aquatile TaxID=1168082 RepID=A0ABW5DM09_9PROT
MKNAFCFTGGFALQAAFLLLSLLPVSIEDAGSIYFFDQPLAGFLALGSLLTLVSMGIMLPPRWSLPLTAAGTIPAMLAPLVLIGQDIDISTGLAAWMMVLAATHGLVRLMAGFAKMEHTATRLLVPALFGLMVLYLWEVCVRGFGVPKVLLPAPSAVLDALLAQSSILAADFGQTFLKSVIAGYIMGNGAAFLTALAVDRSPFLQKGLLPLGNLVSAIPIVGIAPIMVMWFGFDWPSKAAVIVIMTFFPMLISTLAGLKTADAMQKDLMRSYGASYSQTLLNLRLPCAMPMIFNALKLNSTLALIGAIVAEFFGTPIVGMGFRISTEVARMNVDVVWATIAVASLAGSAAYGGIALIERATTFWHPSYRKARG